MKMMGKLLAKLLLKISMVHQEGNLTKFTLTSKQFKNNKIIPKGYISMENVVYKSTNFSRECGKEPFLELYNRD